MKINLTGWAVHNPERIAWLIGWMLNLERTTPASAAREKHLRSLMGLPEKPKTEIDREKGE